MARVKKETAPNRKIALSLGNNYYEIIKDALSFSIQKRNGKGNMSPMGLYPSTFGRALELILNDATQISEKEILSVREYINEIRSIYDQLREVKAEWQIIDKKAYDGNLGIPELTEVEENVIEEEEEDEF